MIERHNDFFTFLPAFPSGSYKTDWPLNLNVENVFIFLKRHCGFSSLVPLQYFKQKSVHSLTFEP